MTTAAENAGIGSYQAGEDIAQYQQVKIDIVTNKALVCGAGDIPFGRADVSMPNGNNVRIRLHNFPGTRRVVMAGACANRDLLYTAAGGKLSTTVVGNPVYMALQAATADGDVVQALPLAAGAGGSGNAIIFVDKQATSGPAVTFTGLSAGRYLLFFKSSHLVSNRTAAFPNNDRNTAHYMDSEIENQKSVTPGGQLFLGQEDWGIFLSGGTPEWGFVYIDASDPKHLLVRTNWGDFDTQMEVGDVATQWFSGGDGTGPDMASLTVDTDPNPGQFTSAEFILYKLIESASTVIPVPDPGLIFVGTFVSQGGDVAHFSVSEDWNYKIVYDLAATLGTPKRLRVRCNDMTDSGAAWNRTIAATNNDIFSDAVATIAVGVGGANKNIGEFLLRMIQSNLGANPHRVYGTGKWMLEGNTDADIWNVSGSIQMSASQAISDIYIDWSDGTGLTAGDRISLFKYRKA
jgi:hypothetical protein